MLYDPKWETETKPGVFSLQSLIAWLEAQPANKAYCYTDSGECLLSKYFTAAGFENVYMFTAGFWHGPETIPGNVGQEEAIKLNRLTRLPDHFDNIAHGFWNENTFGDALRRAHKFAGQST